MNDCIHSATQPGMGWPLAAPRPRAALTLSPMVEVSYAALRARLYESYGTTHSGFGGAQAAGFIYRRDIRPAISRDMTRPILDIGCGQGELVALLRADGFDAHGIDVSPEQVACAHARGVSSVVQGDYHEFLADHSGDLGVVIATDVLEHQQKDEVLATLDAVLRALRPGGRFIARVPNAVSPFGGRIRYGDFTHESSYTPTSVAQLCAAVGFAELQIADCAPSVHGIKSLARAVAWKCFSGLFKLALAAETGVIRGNVVTQNMTFVATAPTTVTPPPAAAFLT